MWRYRPWPAGSLSCYRSLLLRAARTPVTIRHDPGIHVGGFLAQHDTELRALASVASAKLTHYPRDASRCVPLVRVL